MLKTCVSTDILSVLKTYVKNMCSKDMFKDTFSKDFSDEKFPTFMMDLLKLLLSEMLNSLNT
jgi:hypothetical protein